MQTNTLDLWNNFWKNFPHRDEALEIIKAENSIAWIRMEQLILKEMQAFENLECIEIGAGAGIFSALLASRGSRVTVLDYSEIALERSQNFFTRNGLMAEFIHQDALSLPDHLLGRYDISMSFGLTEHFKGRERIAINKAHFDVLKKGGLAFISVPNKYNPPYRLYKFLAELAGRWHVGEEYPYSRAELQAICREIGVTQSSFFGSSLIASLDFINPLERPPFRVIKQLFQARQSQQPLLVKREKGTRLDEYISYALILCGKKL